MENEQIKYSRVHEIARLRNNIIVIGIIKH